MNKTVENIDNMQSSNNIISAFTNDLAVYSIGEGEPLLLFPYPHGATLSSISESLLCKQLVSLGRKVITFDPPSAYGSVRKADYSLKEMIGCGEEALRYFGINCPVDIVGHSMGGFCAIAFVINNKALSKKLLIICGNPGYDEVSSQWFNSRIIRGFDFVKLTYYGFKEIIGLGSLKNHKMMNNLLDFHLFENKDFFEPRPIHKDDWRTPAPLRDKWMDTVRKESYSDRLNQINVPTLIISGTSDILSSESVNEKMHKKIETSNIEYFKKSRHFPFIEEKERFLDIAKGFLL